MGPIPVAVMQVEVEEQPFRIRIRLILAYWIQDVGSMTRQFYLVLDGLKM